MRTVRREGEEEREEGGERERRGREEDDEKEEGEGERPFFYRPLPLDRLVISKWHIGNQRRLKS